MKESRWSGMTIINTVPFIVIIIHRKTQIKKEYEGAILITMSMDNFFCK